MVAGNRGAKDGNCQAEPAGPASHLSMVQRFTDNVVREISSYYHQITSPCIKLTLKIIKTIRQGLNDVSSPTQPQFSAKMAHLNDTFHHSDDVYNRAPRSKIPDASYKKPA